MKKRNDGILEYWEINQYLFVFRRATRKGCFDARPLEG